MLSFPRGHILDIYLDNLDKGRTSVVVYGILCQDIDELLQFWREKSLMLEKNWQAPRITQYLKPHRPGTLESLDSGSSVSLGI